MSETETREPMCTCGHDRIDHIYEVGACRPGFVCQDSCERFVSQDEGTRDENVHPLLSTLSDTLAAAQRLVPIAFDDRDQAYRELDKARAEVSRLRAVVEAVQALADRLEADAGYYADAADDKPAVVAARFLGKAESFDRTAREVRLILAPVSSSGEAESGEAFDRGVGVCTACGTTVAPATLGERCGLLQQDFTHCDGTLVTPAPVSSGGQADEGDEQQQLDDLLMEFGHLRTDPGGTWLNVESLPRVLAALAARPVLSREALRKRLAATLRQNGHVEWTDLDVRNMTEHVLDVLAGGEQA